MTSASIRHLQNLQALLEALTSEGIEMEGYQYDGVSFNEFTLVLAKDHTKVRFAWDGRESILTVELQKVQNGAIFGNWEHDAFIQVPSVDAVFGEIGSNAEAMLQ